MFDAKKLTDEQVTLIKVWAADGAQLAEIQKQMEDDMGYKLTYMDTRFLVLDLGIVLRDLEEEARVIAQQEADAKGEDLVNEEETPDSTLLEAEVMPAQGRVSVSVDSIAQPGLMASGRVDFSDGNAAMWYIDERGLGLNPDVEGYQPTSSDLEAFQLELQMLMDRQ